MIKILDHHPLTPLASQKQASNIFTYMDWFSEEGEELRNENTGGEKLCNNKTL
jgi:hypothetical protein